MDERLSKGLVRAETRTLKESLREHGHEILATLVEGVKSRFIRESRLLPEEMKAVASALHDKASQAYNPLFADLTLTPPTKGRPNAGSYDMLHYWIRPAEVPGEAYHRMYLAVFTANGDRKNVEMSAHDTLVSFYEHAAHRLHQRLGGQQAATRAIGKRLAETIMLPSLALHHEPERLIGSDMHIPFEGGLLLGSFVQRAEEKLPGGYFSIHNRRVMDAALSYEAKAEFLVKTYVGPEMLSSRQTSMASEMTAWLEDHAAVGAVLRRHLFHPGIAITDSGYLAGDVYEALRVDFERLRIRLFQ